MSPSSILDLPDQILVRIIRSLDLATLIRGVRPVCGKLRHFAIRYGEKIELDLNSENSELKIRERKSASIGLKDFKSSEISEARDYFDTLRDFVVVSTVTAKLTSTTLPLTFTPVFTEALCKLAEDHSRVFHVDNLTVHGGFALMNEEMFAELNLAVATFTKHKLDQFVLLANFSSRHLRWMLDHLLSEGIRLSNFFALVENKTDLQYLMAHVLTHNVKVVTREFNLYVKVEDRLECDELELLLQEFAKDVARLPLFMKSSYFTSDLQTSHDWMSRHSIEKVFFQTVINHHLGYKIDTTNTKEAFIIIPSQQFPSIALTLATICGNPSGNRNAITITARKEIILKINFEPLSVDYRSKIYRIQRGDSITIHFDDISRSGMVDYDVFDDFMATQKIVITYADCEATLQNEFPIEEKWFELDGRNEPRFITELGDRAPFTLAIE